MNIRLSALEARILGALLEKEITTPDQYPLSLNALVAACNQKSNRDPVLELDERAVQQALDGLSKRHLVLERSGFGSRVVKWRHRLCNGEHNPLQFSAQETALVCELLLRGPQTPGELRSRAQRLAPFQDLAQVEDTLARLMARADGPFVARLERQPGARESRCAQLFTELPANVQRTREEGDGDAAPDVAPPGPPAGAAIVAELHALLDRQAIHELLARCCRALDRCDVELLRSAYWDDAVHAGGFARGGTHEGAHARCESIVRGLQERFETTTHMLANVLVELHGDVARAEARLLVYGRVAGTRDRVEAVFGARYAAQQSYDPARPTTHDWIMAGRWLDTLQKRRGEWRMSRHALLHDWNRNGPSTAIRDDGIYALLPLAPRDPQDARGP
jgi:uncharacterized protein YceH (UPF0502 family)